MSTPLIGISCCIQVLDAPHHSVFEKYIHAVVHSVGGTPVLLPAIGISTETKYGYLDIDYLVYKLDGLLLTGSPSNIEPHRYGEKPIREGIMYDPERDSTTIPLIHKAIELDLPIFGICRGLQEINVALGGTLIQELEEPSNGIVHRVIKTDVFHEKFLPKHTVEFTGSGWMVSVLRRNGINSVSCATNSLHRQAVDRLGEGLIVEGSTSDGIIEMIKLDRPNRFVVGVQWHPEWFTDKMPIYDILFKEFRTACISRMQNSLQGYEKGKLQ